MRYNELALIHELEPTYYTVQTSTNLLFTAVGEDQLICSIQMSTCYNKLAQDLAVKNQTMFFSALHCGTTVGLVKMSLLMGHICISTYGVLERTLAQRARRRLFLAFSPSRLMISMCLPAWIGLLQGLGKTLLYDYYFLMSNF